LFASEDYEDAIVKYGEAITLNPNNSLYYSNRAECLIRIKNYKESLVDTIKAISLDPSNFKANFRKAVSEFHLKDFVASKNSFTQSLKIENLSKRDIESANSWIEKCEKEIGKMPKIETNNAPKKADPPQTKKDPNTTTKNTPKEELNLDESFSQQHLIIEKFKRDGNFVDAIKFCDKILETKPNDFICLHNLGIIYLNANKPKKAAEYFEKSVSVMPSIEGYKKLAEACFQSSNYKKAAVVCQLASKAIEDTSENEPHLHDFTVIAASALYKDGELNTALQLVTNVLLKNDQHLNACILYGDILLSKKNYTEALRTFIRSLLFNSKEERLKKRISQIVQVKNIEGLSGIQILLKEVSEEKTPSSSLLVFFANMIKGNYFL
jgi:tetratricopeptide (TPR) repeat protein